MKKGNILVLALALAVLPFGHTYAGMLVNGGFESGDFSGWRVVEGAPPDYGTWAVVRSGTTINQGDELLDLCDGLVVQQVSSGLPRTYGAADGDYLAIQLQVGGQDHRLFQDVELPPNATALNWDMFYDNKGETFASDQYMAVHIRDLQDNILETLFMTDSVRPAQIPMTAFRFDISPYAGTAVRIDVEMKVYQNYFDAGFDNFRIEVAEIADDGTPVPETEAAPPGWSRGKGKKGGWDGPVGLNKNGKRPKGFGKGEKTGWKE